MRSTLLCSAHWLFARIRLKVFLIPTLHHVQVLFWPFVQFAVYANLFVVSFCTCTIITLIFHSACIFWRINVVIYGGGLNTPLSMLPSAGFNHLSLRILRRDLTAHA